MDQPEILKGVRDIIAEHVGMQPNEVGDSDDITNDLGADSLDVVEIILACEEEFGVVIPDSLIADLNTPEEIATYIFENSEG